MEESEEVKSNQEIADKSNLINDAEKVFAKLYAKICPFQFLRAVNWFLMMIMLIISLVGSNFHLSYSFRLWGWDRMPILIAIPLVLNSIPMVWKWFSTWRKMDTNFPLLGIMDICFALITVFYMVIVAIFNVLQTMIIYRQFSLLSVYKNFSNISYTTTHSYTTSTFPTIHQEPVFGKSKFVTTALALTPIPILRHYYDYELFYNRHRLLVHSILDPTLSVFATISILLSLFLSVYLVWAFKKSKIWLSNYRDHYPDCAEFDTKYANFWPFGLLKMIEWLFPMVFMSLCLYEQIVIVHLPITLAIVSLIIFFDWTKYMQKAKFRMPKLTSTKSMILNAFLDNLMSLGLILSYFLLTLSFYPRPYYYHVHRKNLCYVGMVNSSILFILTTILICKNGRNLNGANGHLSLPQISIQISVNVNKKEGENGQTQEAGLAKE